jgi:hypothetical protein
MWVNFESKGVFIAGRKIHVSIDFQANTNKLKESQLSVVFPGAVEYPILKGQLSFEKVSSPTIELKFFNESSAHGEKDIVYSMQEQTYTLIINGVIQTPDKFLRVNPTLDLAPPETRLQLKNNSLILILTYFILYFSIVQIVISIKNKK